MLQNVCLSMSFICKSMLPLLLRDTLLPVHFICSPAVHLLSSHSEQSLLEHRKPFLHEHFASVVDVQFSAYTVGKKEMEPQSCMSPLIFVPTTSFSLCFLVMHQLISFFPSYLDGKTDISYICQTSCAVLQSVHPYTVCT